MAIPGRHRRADAHARALALDSKGNIYVAGDDYVQDELWNYSLTRLSGPNVGIARVVEPHDTIRVIRTIIPTVMLYNYSPDTATNVPVYMLIGSTIFSLTVPSLGPYDSTPVRFSSWSSRDAGNFPIRAYTSLSDDWESGDDTAHGFVSVVLPWVLKDSVPIGLKRKYVKDGGSLAFDDSLNVIYAVKGNNTCEFYSYGPVGAWALRESVPVGSGRRKVKKGAAMAYGGNNTVYLAKGNRTAEFWAYHPAAGWVAKSNLPGVLKGRHCGSLRAEHGPDLRPARFQPRVNCGYMIRAAPGQRDCRTCRTAPRTRPAKRARAWPMTARSTSMP